MCPSYPGRLPFKVKRRRRASKLKHTKANLEIFEARGLIGKDISGNSDPFCTFYLTTNPLARYNTSYKARTLNPVRYLSEKRFRFTDVFPNNLILRFLFVLGLE